MDQIMDWNTIEGLIIQAQQPLSDSWLESLQDKFNQNEPYYRFLYHLVLTRKPKIALEIGTYWGIGTAHLAAAAATYGGQVIGIDVNIHETTRDVIPQRYGSLHFIQGDSTRAETYGKVWDLVCEFGPIGVVYQDSSHHYQASCQEWEMYGRLLDQGAVWVCDDITPAFHDALRDPPGKGMVQYFNERPGQKRLYKDVLHYGNSQGVILWP
jgi:cephalosporin hydroxylase